ncbi:hypothetical protein BASA83_012271 [Batrachochytrium salamandrivorans]|nr:hypothetical protein BASA83_012271 [Batrachochytrium salamandrivorans]
MPPTSLLCSHQPAISTLNNVPNPNPNFSDPSTSIFALSSLRNTLLLGTLRIGPISHVADGDSSSTLTHRTVPLQLHIGKHVEDSVVLRQPVFVTDYYWDTLGWKSIIPGLIGFSRMVDFDSSYCLENCFDWVN